MSARLSTSCPLACSGDMYAAVPRMIPCCVAAMLSVGEFERLASAPSPMNAFASPKSSTFTLPSGVTLMFAGFRSAVDDALFVCGFKGFGDLESQLEGFFDRDGTALQPVRQRVAFDEFEDEEAGAFVLFETVDCGYVGVV